MKRICFKCNVLINSKSIKCPLCGTKLKFKNKGEDVFPKIENNFKNSRLAIKILKLITIFATLVSLFIDYMISSNITWSFFVAFAMIMFWTTLKTGIRRKKNILKFLFAELNLVIIASIITDIKLGFTMFSLTYVLPFSIISYISCVFILRIFLNIKLKDYIFYTYINCLIGLIPLLLIINKIIKITWPSSICIILSILLILLLYIFNKKQVEEELERKLHF